MLLITGLVLLVLGLVVWFYGNRMWLLGAGAGALLGFGFLNLFNIAPGSWLGFFIVAGMAILFGVLGFIGKAFTKIIAMVIGFIAGGALVIAFMNLLGMGVSLWSWILALLGGAIGAVLLARFIDWGLIIFASLIGSMLLVRGIAEAFSSTLIGTIQSLLVLVMTGLGIFYHARKRK
jgi:hypothetical protein